MDAHQGLVAMIKSEDFENGVILALTNNVEAIAHFTIGMGGRTQDLKKAQGFAWVPLNKQGFLEPKHTEMIEKVKTAKSVAEMIQMVMGAGAVWVGGSA